MKKYVIGISAAAIVALTAGCGGETDAGAATNPGTTAASTASSTAPATSTEHNDADITFAQMMIPHHQQAVDMADIAATKATDPTVKTLADRIKGAQDPEIQRMTTLLEAWGAAPESTDMPDMEHGAGHGMMTDDQMAQLEGSSGAEFDKMWLRMMIEHHEGAVTMAKAELEQGENPDARTLAQEIIDAQEAEITEMQGMLA